jgi:Holliday junction DNA helicase RuvA
MIEYLKGQLVSFGDNFLVLEAGGLGFKVSATQNTLEKTRRACPKLPASLQILTYLHIQENKWEVFGFFEEQERQAFLLLLGCRGIGTRAALHILSSLPPERLKRIALGEEPVTTLQQVPGIGPKSADRILVELKEKLPEMSPWEDGESKREKPILEYTREDLSRVLRNLGYRTAEIQAALTQSSTLPSTLSEAVKQLLRMMGKM